MGTWEHEQLPQAGQTNEPQLPALTVLLSPNFLPEKAAKRMRKEPLSKFCENLSCFGNTQKNVFKLTFKSLLSVYPYLLKTLFGVTVQVQTYK